MMKKKKYFSLEHLKKRSSTKQLGLRRCHTRWRKPHTFISSEAEASDSKRTQTLRWEGACENLGPEFPNLKRGPRFSICCSEGRWRYEEKNEEEQLRKRRRLAEKIAGFRGKPQKHRWFNLHHLQRTRQEFYTQERGPRHSVWCAEGRLPDLKQVRWIADAMKSWSHEERRSYSTVSSKFLKAFLNHFI